METTILCNKCYNGSEQISLMIRMMKRKKMNCKMKTLFPLTADELSDIDTDSDEDIPASSFTATLGTPSGTNNSTSATPNIPGQLRARNRTL